MSKATIATVKSFIRKNDGKLLVRFISHFDGMIDGTTFTPNDRRVFKPAVKTEDNVAYTHGVAGAWFVGQSRDRITPFEEGDVHGFHVYNCCRSFDLAVTNKRR